VITSAVMRSRLTCSDAYVSAVTCDACPSSESDGLTIGAFPGSPSRVLDLKKE
jgi:hypothetical protein